MEKNNILKLLDSDQLIILIFYSKYNGKSLSGYKNYSLQFKNNTLIKIDTKKSESIGYQIFFQD